MGLGDIGKAMEKLDESMASMKNFEIILAEVLVVLKQIENNTNPGLPPRVFISES